MFAICYITDPTTTTTTTTSKPPTPGPSPPTPDNPTGAKGDALAFLKERNGKKPWDFRWKIDSKKTKASDYDKVDEVMKALGFHASYGKYS